MMSRGRYSGVSRSTRTFADSEHNRKVGIMGAVEAPKEPTPFARMLKELREDRGISQSRLAEAANFDHSYVSRLESGNRAPTREAVSKLADALGLNAGQRDSLLAAAGFMPQRVESLFADEPVLSDVFQLLSNDDIPEPVRMNVRQMLKVMVQQARLASHSEEYPSDPGSQLMAD
jgi:transcriptional regulator with XRE-family HTH domain